MSKGLKEGVSGLFMLVLAILILGVSPGCKKHPAEKTEEPPTLEQMMEEVDREAIVLIATRYNIPSQTVKEILKEYDSRKWEGKANFFPTRAETESAIEGYAQKYQTPKEKIANILWDWMIYNRTDPYAGT